MAFQLRVVDGRGVETPSDGSFPDFGEALRVGVQLADAIGREPEYEIAKAKAIKLYAGARRVLSITIVKGGLPDR